MGGLSRFVVKSCMMGKLYQHVEDMTLLLLEDLAEVSVQTKKERGGLGQRLINHRCMSHRVNR